MSSHDEELDKRIKAWLEIKELDRAPVRQPYVSIPEFPAVPLLQVKKVPKIAASIDRLSFSVLLGSSIPVLASLISLMDRKDAEELYNWLSVLEPEFDIDDVVAGKWFSVSHTLSKESIGYAISGFFILARLHHRGMFHLNFTGTLACLYRVLQRPSSENTLRAELLFKVAEKFPHRFAFVCVRIVSGGDKVVSVVGNLLSKMEGLNLGKEECTSILDFTMETGWLLNRQDYEQIWRLISQKGSRIQERLSGGLVPMSSVRFLAGVFRGIEKTEGMDGFLAAERIKRAGVLFDISSKKITAKTISAYPRLKHLLDHQIKQDFTVETVSHRIAESNHSQLGYSVVLFLQDVFGAVTFAELADFLRAMGDDLSEEVVKFMERLVTGVSLKRRLSPSDFMLFSGIVASVFSACTLQDRTALKAFYRALVSMDHSISTWAVLQLQHALKGGIGISSVLSATSLILRASTEDNIKQNLSRIDVTSRLIDTLPQPDRETILSGLVPMWVEGLLSVDLKSQEKVIEFLNKIADSQNRKRYLENVVTGLLSELHPEDTVFEDCLAFAVNGYNSSGVIERLREIEYEVFRKVFHAGGRIKRVDGLMVDLLAVPGFEGKKTEQLISGIRSICNRFSRLAVWEESGDFLFDKFIVHGVGNLLRAFVDHPASMDFVNNETIELLLNKLIQDRPSSESASRVVNPGGTAQTFFGSILPAAINLFSRDTKALPAFLLETADEFSRSVGGMAAGEDFVEYLAKRLDVEIQQDCVTVLGSWLSQKTPPPLRIPENWSNNWRKEWNALKTREDASRMKLIEAATAISGVSGSLWKDAILNTACLLSRQLERAGIPGAAGLSLKWNREMVQQLAELSGDTPLLKLFEKGDSLKNTDPTLFSYLESIGGFMEQDVFHAWRQAALPPLLNCAVELVLVSGNSQDLAVEMAETATDAVEFLGYDSANSFLSTLQESIRHAKGMDNALALIEKYFLLPLWKRNSAERLDLLMLGMEDNRLLTDILNERLSLEEHVGSKVRFMRNYATLFITVEKAVLEIQSDFEKSKIADGLMDSWIFSGTGENPRKPVFEILDTVELVQDVFRRVKYGRGIVSASEAGEISSDMRRRYRDNADSVAIILRWTVDPAREGLLQLLEESQLLLQAAGTDAELMRLLDIHGAKNGFLEDARPYAEKPAALKLFLMTMSEDIEQE
jgi:hypothetical protein